MLTIEQFAKEREMKVSTILEYIIESQCDATNWFYGDGPYEDLLMEYVEGDMNEVLGYDDEITTESAFIQKFWKENGQDFMDTFEDLPSDLDIAMMSGALYDN